MKAWQMKHVALLLLACLFSFAAGGSSIHEQSAPRRPFSEDGRREVEVPPTGAERMLPIRSHSAIMRYEKADPTSHLPGDIPGAAELEDAAAQGERLESDSFSVSSAQAHYASSGLMKTLHDLQHHEGVEEKPLGTLLALVNSSDEAAMYDLEKYLVPSLLGSLKFKTPMTVLYSGPMAPVDDATIKLHLNPLISLSLVDVTQRVEQFSQEHATKKQETKQGGKNWKMDEFWAMHVHLLPELQSYRYVWRLSPKSTLVTDVSTDLFKVMKEQKSIFGYRLLQNVRTEACTGLQKAAMDFFEANSVPQTLSAKAFLETFEQAQCPQWTSDFQLVDLDYLRSNEVYGEYVAYLAESHGFSQHGWGSHTAQAIFLATQLKPEQMLCMTPWVPSYQGLSRTSCGAGLGLINFGQNSFKDSMLAQGGAALQLKMVHPGTLPILNASNGVLGGNSTALTIARSGHDIVIILSVLVAMSMLGGGIAYKKGWARGKQAGEPHAQDSSEIHVQD